MFYVIGLDEMDIRIIVTLANCNLNVSQTARELFYHRNTVVYRCTRIKELTGLNPTKFFDMVQLLDEMKEENICLKGLKHEWT